MLGYEVERWENSIRKPWWTRWWAWMGALALFAAALVIATWASLREPATKHAPLTTGPSEILAGQREKAAKEAGKRAPAATFTNEPHRPGTSGPDRD